MNVENSCDASSSVLWMLCDGSSVLDALRVWTPLRQSPARGLDPGARHAPWPAPHLTLRAMSCPRHVGSPRAWAPHARQSATHRRCALKSSAPAAAPPAPLGPAAGPSASSSSGSFSGPALSTKWNPRSSSSCRSRTFTRSRATELSSGSAPPAPPCGIWGAAAGAPESVPSRAAPGSLGPPRPRPPAVSPGASAGAAASAELPGGGMDLGGGGVGGAPPHPDPLGAHQHVVHQPPRLRPRRGRQGLAWGWAPRLALLHFCFGLLPFELALLLFGDRTTGNRNSFWRSMNPVAPFDPGWMALTSSPAPFTTLCIRLYQSMSPPHRLLLPLLLGVIPECGTTAGRGGRAGAEIGGKARSQDPCVSRGTP